MRAKALLLTPGAGGDRTHHTLVAVERAVASLPVERVDFPYRKEGRKAPDRAPKLIDCVNSEAASLVAKARTKPKGLVLGGRSMGGRMCSMAVAEGLSAAGLVLLSYPLHPPGKPDKLRVDHFPALDLPCLFISGDGDPFGTPAEFRKHAKKIPGPVTFHWIEGGRHDPARAKTKQEAVDAEIANVVHAWITEIR